MILCIDVRYFGNNKKTQLITTINSSLEGIEENQFQITYTKRRFLITLILNLKSIALLRCLSGGAIQHWRKQEISDLNLPPQRHCKSLSAIPMHFSTSLPYEPKFDEKIKKLKKFFSNLEYLETDLNYLQLELLRLNLCNISF